MALAVASRHLSQSLAVGKDQQGFNQPPAGCTKGEKSLCVKQSCSLAIRLDNCMREQRREKTHPATVAARPAHSVTSFPAQNSESWGGTHALVPLCTGTTLAPSGRILPLLQQVQPSDNQLWAPGQKTWLTISSWGAGQSNSSIFLTPVSFKAHSSSHFDSGAEDNFTDIEFAKQCGFLMETLPSPLTARELNSCQLAEVSHQTIPLKLVISGNHNGMI